MSTHPSKRAGEASEADASPRDRRAKSGDAVPQKISIGFALMAVVPILLALLLYLEEGGNPGVLQGRSGAIFALMIASSLAGFYFIKAELGRTFFSILERASQVASEDISEQVRLASEDEIGRIGDTIAQITATLDGLTGDDREERHRLRQGISRVSHSLQTARDETALGQLLVEGVVETVGARLATLVGIDEEAGDFQPRAAAGEGAEEALRRAIPLGEGVPGLAARERRPILLHDQDIPAPGGGDSDGPGRGPESTMAAPILQGECLHGVLVVEGRKAGGRFGEEELEVLSHLTTLAAVALAQRAAEAQLQRDIDQVIGVFSRAIEERDPYAVGRSARIAGYCESMARSLRLDEDTIRTVKRAALLHGVGKIKLPDSLVRRDGPLTDDELEHVRAQVVAGGTILEGAPTLRTIWPLVRHHNERCDGSGYPDGLTGDAIPLTTHLLIVACAYDAMTSDRSFRQAMPVAEALKKIQADAGRLYDRRAVQALMAVGPGGLKARNDETSASGTVKGKGTASISVLE